MIDTTCPFCQEKDAEISRLKGDLTLADAEIARMRKYQDLMYSKMKNLEAMLKDIEQSLEEKANEHPDNG